MQSNKIYPIALLCLLFFSCHKKYEYKHLTGNTQGSTYSIVYENSNNVDYTNDIDSIFNLINITFSGYDSTSIVSRVNQNNPNVELNAMFCDVFAKSQTVWEESDGAFDITVGALVKAWGFGIKRGQLPDSATIETMKQSIGNQYVSIENNKVIKKKPGVLLDFNAIAQGYTVDLVGLFLESKGIKNYLVEIGGEVRVKGVNAKDKLWKIGIDKPEDGNDKPGAEIQAIIELNNRTVSTSGNYRRFYVENGVKYSHEIDPKTGYPARNTLLSASILADDCTTADAYATVCMVLGLEKSKEFLQKHKNIDAYFIYNDSLGRYQIWKTEGVKVLEE